ncbi:MAG: type I DNA topoisomerase [Prevotella sp.]|nr:type I DNA topoisomerase [Prevotella sp.]
MRENLVIVESPAKAKTIEKFLGSGWRVMSSYGHIRDLKSKELSVDPDTLVPVYEVPEDKVKIVNELIAARKKAKEVWLASDEDREGEAISWHLQEVLGLDRGTTKRIVFHEITRSAILAAIERPRLIDMSLVDAQQARRVLDRLVGFRLSPVLWRKVKPSLSAGRVQSVAVRLIVEREREIRRFVSEPYFRVTATFTKQDASGAPAEIRAELDRRLPTEEEARQFLERCKGARFVVGNVSKKPIRRSPAPPFTTSTLQQEAARRLGFTVSQTMSIAQRLYENGLITYMRTDSVNLSSLCIGTSRKAIVEQYGEEYSQSRNYRTHTRGAQEAHEAIRPTYIDREEIEGNGAEQRLYDLIRRRTLASQMADAQIEKTIININISGEEASFVASGEVILFDGYLKAYHDAAEEDAEDGTTAPSGLLPQAAEGDVLTRGDITATERFTQAPVRYTEGSLVKKMEELGIGRPSTYAPTISTIQQREYVVKGDSKGQERQYAVITLSKDKLSEHTRHETTGKEKGKLIPTDIGLVVNDYLVDNFPDIMDFGFTANVEEKFDAIAAGELVWGEVLRNFWAGLSPEIDKALAARQEHRPGERALGTDPATGKTVYVKIGRFGPMVQIGDTNDEEKPRFARLPKDRTMDTVTLEEALEQFRLPRTLGEIEGKEVTIGVGRFGPYIHYDGKYTSIPADKDPVKITLEEAQTILAEKEEEEAGRHIKRFDEDTSMEILKGRYGPYIAAGGKNFRIPAALRPKASELTYEECKKIVESAPERTTSAAKRRKK